MCDTSLNVIYILLSATIVFAQLVVLIPKLLRLYPFYSNASHAIDKIFELGEQGEYLDSTGNKKVKLEIGIVRKGERGFKELREVIQTYQPVDSANVETIGLAYGRTPEIIGKGFGLSPNYMAFTSKGDELIPVI